MIQLGTQLTKEALQLHSLSTSTSNYLKLINDRCKISINVDKSTITKKRKTPPPPTMYNTTIPWSQRILSANESPFHHLPRFNQRANTQLSPMLPKITKIMELFRTIGSTNQKLSTPQHENFTVAPHLLSRYGMEARLASHTPSYSTVFDQSYFD
ncbi:hypothetical protein TNCV_544551 [Trichonephila clavipes]|nr:hypothetical protein TNCV_544551 [Trichonephila clavipes]